MARTPPPGKGHPPGRPPAPPPPPPPAPGESYGEGWWRVHTHPGRGTNTHSEQGRKKKKRTWGGRSILLGDPKDSLGLFFFLREEGRLDHDVADLVRVRVRGRATVLKVSLAGDGDGLGDTDRGTARGRFVMESVNVNEGKSMCR